MVIDRTCAARGANEGRSLHPSCQLDVDRSCLSAAASPAARCCSRCQDATRSRAIQRRKNRNRDDHRNIADLAPMQPRLRSPAAPLPRQVSLHSWFNLLEVAFNCPQDCYRLMALFIRSALSRDFAQPAGINFRVRRPGAAASYRRMINLCSAI
jgi:hypothetical protein